MSNPDVSADSLYREGSLWHWHVWLNIVLYHAGCPPEKFGLHDDSHTAVRERDRRRRTNVVMEDVADADHTSTAHFLTPELAARSALFRG